MFTAPPRARENEIVHRRRSSPIRINRYGNCCKLSRRGGEGRDNWEKSTTLSLDRPLDSLTAGDNCWAELVGGNALRGAEEFEFEVAKRGVNLVILDSSLRRGANRGRGGEVLGNDKKEGKKFPRNFFEKHPTKA